MNAYAQLSERLAAQPARWLVTGVAGFIGSNLLECLLRLGQTVVGLDNFLTGHQKNLDMVRDLVGGNAWQRFTFIEGDIRCLDTCRTACADVRHVLHEAALGSVPRSIDDPLLSDSCNITGFLNMLVAARDAGAQSFVYAASSSTYGDSPELPKKEDNIGSPLSPYAVTKYVNELYADVFHRCYGFSSIGLRYFNVFGPQEQHKGKMASIFYQLYRQLKETGEARLFRGTDGFGDGEQRRDFIYVKDVVRINLWFWEKKGPSGIYNCGTGEAHTYNEAADAVIAAMGEGHIGYRDFPEVLRGKYQSFTEADPKNLLRAGYDGGFTDFREAVREYVAFLDAGGYFRYGK